MEFVLLFILLACIYGYVCNIVRLFSDFESPIIKIIRIFGIFVPIVGAILGFITQK